MNETLSDGTHEELEVVVEGVVVVVDAAPLDPPSSAQGSVAPSLVAQDLKKRGDIWLWELDLQCATT